MTHIQIASHRDREYIRKVYTSAFPKSESARVSTLAINLLNEKTSPETISMIAKVDGNIVAHVAFSPVTMANNKDWTAYILAPLAVHPAHQKRQIGTKLITAGIKQLSANGIHMLFVYGDPDFYDKFGFKAETAAHYTPPYRLKYPFGWQAITLNETEFLNTNQTITCVDSLCHPELW